MAQPAQTEVTVPIKVVIDVREARGQVKRLLGVCRSAGAALARLDSELAEFEDAVAEYGIELKREETT